MALATSTTSRFTAMPKAPGGIDWSYLPVVGFVLLSAGLLVIHAGRVLNLGFPLLATIVAITLFILSRHAYVAFTLWIWLFSPEVRRLVDYQTQYHNVSPVMVTPLLVSSFGFFYVVFKPRLLTSKKIWPFTIFGGAVIFSFIVGTISTGFLPAAFECGNWLLPLGFGVFLMADREGFERNREAFIFAATLGLLVIGAYGLYQFYNLPPWDAFWLNSSKFDSAGAALAEQVRIFGPLNSPGPYGETLMSLSILLFVSKGVMRLPAAVAGFSALALCGVRAAWGGFAIGAIIVIWQLGGKARLRLIVLMLILAAVAEPILTVGPVSVLVTNRFSTLSNLQQDDSFQARQELYENFLATAMSQPIGAGFGTLGVSTKLTTGATTDFDSGILELPYEFGWVGGAILGWAIVIISINIIKAHRATMGRIGFGGIALYFALLAELLSGPVYAGVGGILIWSAAAIALGAGQP